ncbi:MAG TPA: outer membrane beta-barrel protein, partial [Elusimicrobiota bacterium]|nr:outer membrane beta-barrel protein [Elusimicrobiota bacterium]
MKIRSCMAAALSALLLSGAAAKAAQTASAAVPTNEDLQAQVQTLEKRLAELEKHMGAAAAPATEAPAMAGPAYSWPGSTSSQPFDFADFTWLNGTSRERVNPFDGKYFTPELRLDANYTYDFNNPKDHSLDGSCEVGRTDELQVQQLGIGGDLHYGHVRGRVMTQFGMYSQMTPRNDASPARGQWNLGNAYQYVSEANAGYHFDAWH